MNKIGIIGIGTVGSALLHWFKKKKDTKIYLYDKYKNIGSLRGIKKAEIIFICVPTPYKEKEGYNLSYLNEAISYIEGEKVVVIKSTVLPGTTEKFQEKFPNLKFFFNPEFLSERTAIEDFENPDRQIIGYVKSETLTIADKIMEILPRAPFEVIVRANEAEMVKLFNNAFNAMKVIFANQMYDLCKAFNIDYDTVKDCASRSKFIGTSEHLEIFHKGYRGYGGKCLPKDVKALIEFAKMKNIKLQLIEMVDKINKELENGKY